MLSYKEFKKEYLNEWVDRSQAARKAAEELANKEVKTSLRNLYKDTLIFILDEHKVEFKGENEKKRDGDIYFTYDEAKKSFGKPNRDGWRLPTEKEFEALRDNYSYKFDKEGKQGIFDNRLYLPAAGYRTCYGGVHDVGSDEGYWSSTPRGSHKARFLNFDSGRVYISSLNRCFGFSVRLVRDVK